MNNVIWFHWALKTLLMDEANFGILNGFLSEVFLEDVSISAVIEGKGKRLTTDDNANRVLLKVLNRFDDVYIVEIQSNYEHDFLLRMIYSTAKIIDEKRLEELLISEAKKIISVNVIYFDLGHGEDYLYYGSTSFIGMNKKDTLNLSKQEQVIFNTEKIEKIYPEYYIIKVNQFDNVAKNTLDEWINFLKNEDVRDGSKAKGLIEAKEKLDVMKLSDAERHDYEHFIENDRDDKSVILSNFLAGQLKGEEKVRKQIEEKIAKEVQLEFAKNILAEGFSIEFAARITRLSIDEMASLTN